MRIAHLAVCTLSFIAWGLITWSAMGASYAHAWSAQGHATIVQDAFNQLTEKEQAFFDYRAKLLLKYESAESWQRSLGDFSPLARIAAWPDARKDMDIDKLFKRFAKAPVPDELAFYRGDDTRAWHYVNVAFWDHQTQVLVPAKTKRARCYQKPKGELLRAWPQLMSAYDEASTTSEQAVLIAFIAHLLADAYQPLHSFAAQYSNCNTDLGGNKHCLAKNKKGRCHLNLHRLWDGGFDVFEPPSSTAVKESNTHKGEASSEADDIVNLEDLYFPSSLKAVVDDNLKQAAFIYSAPVNTMPSDSYNQRAKTLVKSQREQATSVMLETLKYLYHSKRKD